MLLGDNDAHAKNFAIVHLPGRSVLADVYDAIPNLFQHGRIDYSLALAIDRSFDHRRISAAHLIREGERWNALGTGEAEGIVTATIADFAAALGRVPVPRGVSAAAAAQLAWNLSACSPAGRSASGRPASGGHAAVLPLMMADEREHQHDQRRAEYDAHDDHPGTGQAARCSRSARASARRSCSRSALLGLRGGPGGGGTRGPRQRRPLNGRHLGPPIDQFQDKFSGLYGSFGFFGSSIGTSRVNACLAPSMRQAPPTAPPPRRARRRPEWRRHPGPVPQRNSVTMGAPSRIRTCAHGSGGRCSIPELWGLAHVAQQGSPAGGSKRIRTADPRTPQPICAPRACRSR